MRIVTPSAPAVALPPIPSSPELLLSLADEMDDVSRGILELFATKDDLAARGMSEEERDRAWDERRKRENEAKNRYQVEYAPAIVHLYEQARSRGFPDEKLEREYEYIPVNSFGFVEVGSRLGALARRIRLVADG